MPYDIAGGLRIKSFDPQEYEAGQLQNQLAKRHITAYDTQQNELRKAQAAALLKQHAQQINAAAQYALQSPSPKAFVQQNFPDLITELQKTSGVDWNALTDDDVRTMAQGVLAQTGASLGVGPEKPAAAESFSLKPGEVRYDARGKQIAAVPVAPEQAPAESFTPYTQADGSLLLVGNRGTIKKTGYQGKLDEQKAPAGYRFNPDGTLSSIPGGPSDAKTGKPTDTERTAAGFLNRMEKAETMLKDFTPSTRDFIGFGRIINGGATTALLGNALMSEEGQKYYQAASDWVRAKLRKESGAVIGPQEMEQEVRTYFPLPNDPPSVVQQKARARATATEAMRSMAAAAGGAAPPMAEQAPVTATGPNGQKVMLQNGQWVPVQ